MVIRILHGKTNPYMLIWIPTFMLAVVLPQYWQLAQILTSQHNEWCHKTNSFPVQKIFWLSSSCKITSQNGEIMKKIPMLLDVK